MSKEVTTRPVVIDLNQVTQTKLSFEYDFPLVSVNKFDNVEYKDVNITGKNKFYTYKTKKNPIKSVVFNNTLFQFDGVLLTKQGDIFETTDTSKGVNASFMLVCSAKDSKNRKLYITIPLNRMGSTTSPEVKDFLDNDSISKGKNFSTDLNKFIPKSDFFVYNYLSSGDYDEKTFIVFDDSELMISDSDHNKLNISSPSVSVNEFETLEDSQVFQSTTFAIRKPLDSYKSDDIYIDCSPESDVNTRIIKPKRVYAIKKMDLFGLDAVEGYGKFFIFTLIALIILFIIYSFVEFLKKLGGAVSAIEYDSQKNDIKMFSIFKNVLMNLSFSKKMIIGVIYLIFNVFILGRKAISKENKTSFLNKMIYKKNSLVLMILYSILSAMLGLICFLFKKKNLLIYFAAAFGLSFGLVFFINIFVLSKHYRPEMIDIILFSIGLSMLYTVNQGFKEHNQVTNAPVYPE